MPNDSHLAASFSNIQQFCYQCLQDLTDDQGIAASSKNEAYGCLFGRDSAITILKILNVYQKKPEQFLLDICTKTLLTHTAIQGKTLNIESGEEPGKFVHEFRTNNYDRLVNRPKPWYIYPDGVLKNYDSIDSTPLLLIAIYKYWSLTKDNLFLTQVLNQVEAGLNWIINYGDDDHDYLIEYRLPAERKHGGLAVQSWTDSHHCLIQKNGNFPLYPIAPIEVQAYCWQALKLWSKYFSNQPSKKHFAYQLENFANHMKLIFNQSFLYTDRDLLFGAQALDGNKKQIQTITANPLLCLWASIKTPQGVEAILDHNVIKDFIVRAFENDLFDYTAGIRTMSTDSPLYNSTQTSYHNGSFWPVLNGMIYEGLNNFNFWQEAETLKKSSLLPIQHFQCPIELYQKNLNQNYLEYQSASGKKGCRYQAWSAAAILDFFTANELLTSSIDSTLYPTKSLPLA